MREPQGQLVKRLDYQASAFFIDQVDLTFDLDPAKTRVLNRMRVRRNPDVGAIVHTHGFWLTAQAAFGRPLRTLNNLASFFYERTCVSPNDDFASIGPALRDKDIAIIVPWHGAITVGADIAEAAALHVAMDYAARLDVTLPAHTPVMPHEMCYEMRALVEKAGYLAMTWDLIRRKGRDAFDGQRVVPRLAA